MYTFLKHIDSLFYTFKISRAYAASEICSTIGHISLGLYKELLAENLSIDLHLLKESTKLHARMAYRISPQFQS
jgi:hypothetical protein